MHGLLERGVADQQVRQARLAAQRQPAVQPPTPKVGIDQQGATIRARECERQVGAHKGLSISTPGARYRHRDWLGRAMHVQYVKPDSAERLDHRVRALRTYLVAVTRTAGHDAED